ncbi:GTP-binding protein [Cytobacillus citreus]
MMSIDKKLISKRYYETLIEGIENVHPIQILGNMYLDEQQEEVSELSFIRFAQGEVYFHNRDYEAAIFKWENISNELEPWAKKNMADAYFELALLSTAEDIYKLIQTDSDVLKTEVLLQLFRIYVARGKLDLAVEKIKEAVSFNPDYRNVTEIAKEFFEEHQDWKNAIELAVNESVRTGDLAWFDTLLSYVEQERMKKTEPNYFNEALVELFKLDLAKFERLSGAFWNNYRNGDLYISWIKEFNQILLYLESGNDHTWRDLSALYNDTYFEFINGKYLIRELAHLIPNHLANWVKITDSKYALIAAASTLAWSEIFTNSIDPSTLNTAENIVNRSARYHDGLDDGFKLFESVISWAKINGIEIGKRFEWMVHELLDLRASNVLITGVDGNSKSNFINAVLEENVMNESISSTVMFKDDEFIEMKEITDEGIRAISDFSDAENITQTMILCKKPISFLYEHEIAFIDTPPITGLNRFKNDAFQYLQLADSLLFVLNPDTSFTEEELEIVVKIRDQASELPIHFLLNGMGANELTQEIFDNTVSRVNTYFPKSKVFAYSGHDDQYALSSFLKAMNNSRELEEERIAKVQHYVRKTIKYLLERRVEIENGYIESIKWNENLVTKINGATHQLSDLEEEKTRIIKRSFTKIKDDIKQGLFEDIPKILGSCSELITEDSEFAKIHIKLNDEMNHRISKHIEEAVMPRFERAINHWIVEANNEFEQGQGFLNEMSKGFNDLYEEDKLVLACDFRVLDDWRRDADRMTRGSVQLEKVNILNRFSPSQFLLKSAGKLLGALQQNNAMLHNKYKQFVENEDYSGVADTISNQFFHGFELFEKALDRDISMFFSHPLAELKAAMDESLKEIEEHKESLNEMRTNPETYRDPITLFQLKLLQIEWMTSAGEGAYQY